MAEFDTAISEAVPGKVLIRGYVHADIIGNVPYADTVFLTLMGELPTPTQARMVDAMLTSLLDHGFVAATVSAARYIASGNPNFVPAVAGGLLAAGQNTLSPEHAYQLIAEARQVQAEQNLTVEETAAVMVARVRSQRRRFPGFGHPTHRDGDFRADALFALAQKLDFIGEATAMYLAIHREFVSATGRTDIPVNIDGCLACIGMDMGFSSDQVVAIALLAVLPGLMGHVIEEIQSGKPLRYIHDGGYSGQPERPLPAAGN